MSWLTSPREKRLWIASGLAVGAIYSTIGIAPKVANIIRDDDVSAIFFLLAICIIGMAVLVQGLNLKPRGSDWLIILGLVAVYIMLFSRLTMIAERSHLIEYSAVALLVYEAIRERRLQGRSVPVPVLIAVLLSSTIGVIDECLQLVVPGRVFDPVDMLFNAMASTVAVVASWSLHRIARYVLNRKK